jgi:hypothetical protein
MDVGSFIKASLGDDVAPFDYEINDVPRRGWVKRSPGTGAISDETTSGELSRLVEQHWRDFHVRDVRLFLGPGYLEVSALPGLPVLDIVLLAHTGSCNAGSPAAEARMPHVVRDALAAVYEIAPFEVQFADYAGLRATFLAPVSHQSALVISDLLQRVDPECVLAVESELRAMGIEVPQETITLAFGPDAGEQVASPDFEQAHIIYLTKAERLRLWWD